MSARLGIYIIILYIIATIKIRKGDSYRGQATLDRHTSEEVIHKQSENVATSKESENVATSKQTDRFARGVAQIRGLPEKVRREHITDIKIGDVIPVAALITTIVLAFVIPFIQAPVLDYTTTGPFPTNKEYVQRFEIVINNVGLATADHVIVSLHAENTKFLGFTTQPFLGSHVNDSLSNKTRTGLLEFDALPSGSRTNVTFTVSSDANPEPDLTTYVRSSKVVGSHQSYELLIFYFTLLVSYAILAVIFSSGVILPVTDDNKRNYTRFAAAGIIISSGIISGNMLLYLPFLHSNDILFRIYYYVGPLLIPATILVLSLIFFRLTSEAKDRNLQAGLASDHPQIVKYNSVKDDYYYICFFTMAVIFTLSGLTLLSYLPNIQTSNIFYKISFWGGIIGILGLLLTAVGSRIVVFH